MAVLTCATTLIAAAFTSEELAVNPVPVDNVTALTVPVLYTPELLATKDEPTI